MFGNRFLGLHAIRFRLHFALGVHSLLTVTELMKNHLSVTVANEKNLIKGFLVYTEIVPVVLIKI